MEVSRRYSLGTLAIIVIVLLRLGIGWHFYREGATKLNDSNFSSAGFLQAARGPLAPRFHMMIWDADGRTRLDVERQRETWSQYRGRLMEHYGFTEKQRAQAEDVFRQRERQLRVFFDANAADIDEYLAGLDRRDKHLANPARRQVPSLRAQSEQWRSELGKKGDPLLSQLDDLWMIYRRDLTNIATQEQLERASELPVRRPDQPWLTTETIDKIIPWFDIIVGACLILGLFTPIASVAGALFLFSVMLTQPPWVPGTQPIYYQSIEMLALLTLAAVGAGRFAGLDFFIHALRMRCCPPKNTGNEV